jgi:hypothetical protein
MMKRSILHRLIPKQMNPIVVKELRQAVRSRFVAGVLLLFLAIELFGIGMILLTTSTRHINNLVNYHVGRDMFHFLYIALSTACLLFVPAYAGIRLAIERWDNNLDLLYITTIKPQAVVRGKLFAATVITLLLFSAATPFMSLSYLLRGVDIPSIFVAMGFMFLIVIAVTEIALFLACIPTSRAFKVLLGLAAASGIFSTLMTANVAGWALIRSGAGSSMKTSEFWIGAISVIGGVILGVGLLQHLAVALISPSSSNRARPVRIYATIMWIIVGCWVFIASHQLKEPEIMMAWMIPSIILLGAAMLIGLSEETKLSARVRHTIPLNPILRRLALFTYNGPAGAMAWSLSLSIITLVVSYASMTFLDSGRLSANVSDIWWGFLSLTLYFLAYGLTAVLIWRKLLWRRFRSSIIWIVAVILMTLGALLPSIFALLLKANTHGGDWQAWYVGNIFFVADDDHIVAHMIFSSVAAAVMLALNGPWFFRQMRAFVRPAPTTP